VPMPGLLNVQNGLLRAPFERHLNLPGECFRDKTGRLPALHDEPDDCFPSAQVGQNGVIEEERIFGSS
jgi:hypothetical protein